MLKKGWPSEMQCRRVVNTGDEDRPQQIKIDKVDLFVRIMMMTPPTQMLISCQETIEIWVRIVRICPCLQEVQQPQSCHTQIETQDSKHRKIVVVTNNSCAFQQQGLSKKLNQESIAGSE